MIILGFILGAILGSFIKATSERLIHEQGLGGRSYCLECKKTLNWFDLIPVFSYLVLKAKCRYCHKKIPVENLITEIVLGVVGALIFYITPFGLDLVFKLSVLSVLSVIFLVDLESGLILDKITYPASIVTLLYLIYRLQVTGNSNELIGGLLSAILGALFFSFLIIITRGRGMGWGDVKFIFLLGLILGFPNILVGVFLAFLSGAMVALGLIFFGKKRFGQTVPFGPFLSFGALIALLWGQRIINWYLRYSTGY